MFDSTPPNLPVEPQAPTPPSTSPAAAPVAVPPVAAPRVVSGRKEPEDIFSGLDVAAEQQAANAGDPLAMHVTHRSPVKIIAAVVGGIVVVGIAGYAIWAFLLTPTEPPAPTPAPTSIPAQIPTPIPIPQIEQPPITQIPEDVFPNESTATQTPTTQVPPGANIPLPVPAPEEPAPVAVPVEGRDSDIDGLTDLEEPIYGTSNTSVDSDGDSYGDGMEVKGIFNPLLRGQALTTNPAIGPVLWNGWSVLLPKTWAIAPDAQDSSIGYITTNSATRVTVQVRANASRQTLAGWIGPSAEGMRAFTTTNGYSAMQSVDGLTTYLLANDTILIVTYDLNGEGSYEYRTTYQMIVNAFRVSP